MNKIKLFFTSLLKKDATKTVITSLWCALLGLVLGFIILLIINARDAAYGMTSVLGNYLILVLLGNIRLQLSLFPFLVLVLTCRGGLL